MEDVVYNLLAVGRLILTIAAEAPDLPHRQANQLAGALQVLYFMSSQNQVVSVIFTAKSSHTCTK